jgi:hypothetical protein
MQALIFPSASGTVVDQANLMRRVLKPAARTAGVPWTGFHTLRHTCATMLFRRGVNPKQASSGSATTRRRLRATRMFPRSPTISRTGTHSATSERPEGQHGGNQSHRDEPRRRDGEEAGGLPESRPGSPELVAEEVGEQLWIR